MSEKRDARGNIEWRVTNKEFRQFTGGDGKRFRVAARTRLEQPANKGDLTVRWLFENKGVRRELNGSVDTTLFTIPVPQGLAICGQTAPSDTPPGPPEPQGGIP
jgi:hypothetical protein